MKVQIEKTIHEIQHCLRLNNIIAVCLEHKSIDDCLGILERNFKNNYFNFGRGGSHMWVSYKNERVLFVTEQ